jgi:hypothetical protein
MTPTISLQITLDSLIQAVTSLDLDAKRHLLDIIEQQIFEAEEVSLLSEPALAEDWLTPEEDEAWQQIQEPKPQKRRSGILQETFVLPLPDSFDEPLEDFQEYMS